MELKDKYTTDIKDINKLLIPIETYAVCEFLEELTRAIRRLEVRK